jgi:hypothetical protein
MGDLDLETEQELLDAEFAKWEQLHLPHPKDIFRVDAFHVTCRLDALTDLLIDKGVIDRDEYMAALMKEMREKMEIMKPELTKAVRDAKIAPNNGTKLFGPDGRPLI